MYYTPTEYNFIKNSKSCLQIRSLGPLVAKRRLEDHEEQRTLMGSLLSVAYACNTGGMGALAWTYGSGLGFRV